MLVSSSAKMCCKPLDGIPTRCTTASFGIDYFVAASRVQGRYDGSFIPFSIDLTRFTLSSYRRSTATFISLLTSPSPLSNADNSSTPPPAIAANIPSGVTSLATSHSSTALSNPTQTLSGVSQTTPNESTPSTISSTDTPTTTVPSPLYVTDTIPEVVTTCVSSSIGGSSTANIAGPVAGGVAVVAILTLLIFCIRRRARNNKFDSTPDPDHVVEYIDVGGGTPPRVGLAGGVTPFPQSHPNQSSSSMRQLGKSPYIPVPSPSAPSGHANTKFYPQGAAGSSEGGGDVVVHQDAGRAPTEELAPPRELPPPYESIGD
ncbi:hypothetical protein HD554DRAFT_1721258 [Boletus coccyginus]|nr:hypothetical protein HD554DRAFT_1721258 [Boletus coccyginus]